MERTVALLDGDHVLRPPTFLSLILMDRYGVDLEEGYTPANTAGMLATLLTDSEPLLDGHPAQTWTMEMAAKVIDPATVAHLWDAVDALMAEAAPKSKAKIARPTLARVGWRLRSRTRSR